jgi:hypothetical protein
MIKLLDLRLHHVITSPHYGDATDDETPTGQTGANQAKMDTDREEKKADKKINQEMMGRWEAKPRQT